VKNFRIFGQDKTKPKLRAQKREEKIKFGECLEASRAECQSSHSLSQNTKITI